MQRTQEGREWVGNQRTMANYLACLLRSVTLTLPRTRLRYNLEEGTPGEERPQQRNARCTEPGARPGGGRHPPSGLPWVVLRVLTWGCGPAPLEGNTGLPPFCLFPAPKETKHPAFVPPDPPPQGLRAAWLPDPMEAMSTALIARPGQDSMPLCTPTPSPIHLREPSAWSPTLWTHRGPLPARAGSLRNSARILTPGVQPGIQPPKLVSPCGPWPSLRLVSLPESAESPSPLPRQPLSCQAHHPQLRDAITLLTEPV